MDHDPDAEAEGEAAPFGGEPLSDGAAGYIWYIRAQIPGLGPYALPVPVARYATEPEGTLALVFSSVPASQFPVTEFLPYSVGYDEIRDAWRLMLKGFDRYRGFSLIE